MLNELREYALCLEENTADIPLQQSALSKREGFRRLLRILARGFLEKCEDQGLEIEQSIRYCRGFLQTWVNGEIPGDLVIPDSCHKLLDDVRKARQNSLMRHAEKMQEGRKEEEKQLERLENLKKGVANFNEPPYKNAWNTSRNDFNRIYYDQIIADALNRKPLRNQCLVMKRDKLFGISCGENLRKIALAVVCMYLQDLDEFDRPVSAEYLPLVSAEVGNWLHVRVKRKDRKSDSKCVALAIEKARWSEPPKPLFEKQTKVNVSKLRVDPEWLDQYGVELRDAKDNRPLPEGYVKIYDADFLGA